jgi:replication-associated recombination protein RarA
MEEEKTKSKDDFYAVVSALARFIETADNDAAPEEKKKL